MIDVSVIIPSRNELFLPQTVDSLFAMVTGDIEVVVILDGYWPDPPLIDRPNLHIIHFSTPRGLRAGDNAGAAIAKGKYLLKTDAHMLFSQGFDVALAAECDGDWVVVPRRYSLDPDKWERTDKSPTDYHFLDCPLTNPEFFQMHGVIWKDRDRDPRYKDLLIDDQLSWQGSCWFMTAEHFHKRLGGLSEEGYGTFSQEPQEIGMKTWLGGGRVVINKKVWFAHLHKGKRFGRMYHMGQNEVHQGHMYSAHYWMENKWEKRIHDFSWLIDRFYPIPTWPDNWQELPHIHGQPGRDANFMPRHR